jgi:hypothetical protein
MKMNFEDLPEKFSTVVIVGGTRTAFCFADEKAFILWLDETGKDVIKVDEAMPLDNVNMRIDMALWPVYLHDVSRENALETLRKLSQRLLPCQYMGYALDKRLPDDLRMESLKFVQNLWPEDVTSVRCHLLSGLIMGTPDTAKTRELCNGLGFIKILPLLDELDEVAPFWTQTEAILTASVFEMMACPLESVPLLLDGGLAVETAFGLARKDFSRLDAVIGELSQKPELLALCPNAQKILEGFAANLRTYTVGNPAKTNLGSTTASPAS